MNTIYAWGYGDILENILISIASLFANNGYMVGVIKLMVLVGMILTLLSYFSDYGQRDPLRIFKFYVLAIGMWGLFLQVKTNVQIDDIQYNRVVAVQNVPVIIAKPLALFSQLQKDLMGAVDSAFGLPDACKGSKTGVLTCPTTLLSALNYRIQDPYASMSFNQFIQNCVYTDLLEGRLDLNTIQTSQNVIGLFSSHQWHPVRFTKVYVDNTCSSENCTPCSRESGCTMSCMDAWYYVKAMIETHANPSVATPHLAKLNALTETAMGQILGTAPSYLLRINNQSTNLLSQAIVINHVGDAYLRWAEANLAPGLGYSLGITERNLEQQGITNQFLMGKYAPALKGVIITLLVGSLPALAIMVFTPMAVKSLIGYATMFLWILFWTFSEAILNAIMMVKMSGNASNFSTLTFYTISMHASNLSEYIAMAGMFYNYIPILSFLFVSGFSVYAMKGMTSGVISSMTSASTSPVSEAVRGSPSYSNLQYGNINYNNMRFGELSGMTSVFFKNIFDNVNAFGGSVGISSYRGSMRDVNRGILGQDFLQGLRLTALAGGRAQDIHAVELFSAIASKVLKPGEQLMVNSVTSSDKGIQGFDIGAGDNRIVYDASSGNVSVYYGGSMIGNYAWNGEKFTPSGQFSMGANATHNLANLEEIGKATQIANRLQELFSKAFNFQTGEFSETAYKELWQELQQLGKENVLTASAIKQSSDAERISALTKVMENWARREGQVKAAEINKRDIAQLLAQLGAGIDLKGMKEELIEAFLGDNNNQPPPQESPQQGQPQFQNPQQQQQQQPQRQSRRGFWNKAKGVAKSFLKAFASILPNIYAQAEQMWLASDGSGVYIKTENDKYYKVEFSKEDQAQLTKELLTSKAVQNAEKQSFSDTTSTGKGQEGSYKETESKATNIGESIITDITKSYLTNVAQKYTQGYSVSTPLLMEYQWMKLKEGESQGKGYYDALADAIVQSGKVVLGLSNPNTRADTIAKIGNEYLPQSEAQAIKDSHKRVQGQITTAEEELKKKVEEAKGRELKLPDVKLDLAGAWQARMANFGLTYGGIPSLPRPENFTHLLSFNSTWHLDALKRMESLQHNAKSGVLNKKEAEELSKLMKWDVTERGVLQRAGRLWNLGVKDVTDDFRTVQEQFENLRRQIEKLIQQYLK